MVLGVGARLPADHLLVTLRTVHGGSGPDASAGEPTAVGPGDGASVADCRPVLAVRPLGPRDVVRLPREGAEGWEGALALAGAHAARRADERVRAVFPDWGRIALSGASAAPRAITVDERAVAALDLAGLADELVGTFDLGESRLGLSEAGTVVSSGRLMRAHAAPFGIAETRVGPVAQALADGACVSIVGVDEYSPRVMRHLEDVERTTTGMSRLDLVVAGPGGAVEVGMGDGFARILVAASGTALVTPATPPGPPADPPGPARAAGARDVLTIGGTAAALLPSTHGATVRAEGDALVGVWVVPVATRATLLARLADEVAFFPAFRAELPYDLGAPPVSYGGSLFDDDDRLRAALLELVDGDRIGRAVGRLRAAVPARSTGSFQAVMAVLAGDPIPPVRLPAPGGVLVPTAPTAADDTPVVFGAPGSPVRVVVAGRWLELAEHAARTVAVLADGDVHDIDAIHHCPAGDPACGRRLVRALAEAGLVDVGGRAS